MELTAEIEVMEKDPDSYNDADLDEIKIKIKQVEALIKELKLSIGSSTTVFESLHVQVSPVDGNNHIHHINRETIHLKKKCEKYFQITVAVATLDRLEKTYDKNVVLLTRREYLKVQLQLEECERRHQEIFNPNIGEFTHSKPHLNPSSCHCL